MLEHQRMDEIYIARVLRFLYIAFVLSQDMTTAVDTMYSWSLHKAFYSSISRAHVVVAVCFFSFVNTCRS